MKIAAGILLGFALMPLTIGLIGVFTWAGMHWQLRRVDLMLGVAIGIATIIVVGALSAITITDGVE